jgi:hypothetical protein
MAVPLGTIITVDLLLTRVLLLLLVHILAGLRGVFCALLILLDSIIHV